MLQKTEQPFTHKTMLAGGAITANSIVKFGSDDDNAVLAAAATDKFIGVSGDDAAASGERTEIQMQGIANVKIAGTIARGDDVTSDAAGLGVALSAAATIKSSIGRALASGVTGDIIPVHLNIWSAVTA